MSDLSRRDFLKQGAIGAAGVIAAGSASSLLAGSPAQAKADKDKKDAAETSVLEPKRAFCVTPEPPTLGANGTTSIDVIGPESDQEEIRCYSALVPFMFDGTNWVAQTIQYDGTDYDPFDGGTYTHTGLQTGARYKFLARGVCFLDDDFRVVDSAFTAEVQLP